MKQIRELLNYYGVNYIERCWSKDPPSVEEISNILSIPAIDIYDLLSTQSRLFIQNKEVVAKMPLSQFKQFICQKPQLLRPLTIQANKLVVGYSEEELRMFIDKNYKKRLRMNAIMRAYSLFENQTEIGV